MLKRVTADRSVQSTTYLGLPLLLRLLLFESLLLPKSIRIGVQQQIVAQLELAINLGCLQGAVCPTLSSNTQVPDDSGSPDSL